jgi:hypothetical protein
MPFLQLYIMLAQIKSSLIHKKQQTLKLSYLSRASNPQPTYVDHRFAKKIGVMVKTLLCKNLYNLIILFLKILCI